MTIDLREKRKEIQKLVISYANSSKTDTDFYITTNLSSSTILSFIDNSIIEHIVEMDIIKKIVEKKSLHDSDNTSDKFHFLLKQREEFHLQEEVAISYVTEYSCSDLTLNDFCFENAITQSLLIFHIKNLLKEKKLSPRVIFKLNFKARRSSVVEEKKIFSILKKENSNEQT